jgi:uncharacterized protein YciI
MVSLKGCSMAFFLVEVKYTDDRDKLMEVRPKHREFLKGLLDQGKLLHAGPLEGDLGGLSIYDVADRAEAEAIFATDPYSVNKVAVESSIREWTIVLTRQ